MTLELGLDFENKGIKELEKILKSDFKLKRECDTKSGKFTELTKEQLKRSGYKEIYVHNTDEGQYIAILKNPYYPYMSQFLFVCHLSQWVGLLNFQEYCIKLFGKKIFNDILNYGKPLRVDLCVDEPVKFKTVAKYSNRSRITKRVSYESDLDTIYIGSWHSDKNYVAYEKLSSNYSDSPLTRIELRLKSHQVPIENLAQYPSMVKLNLFDDLYFQLPSKQFIKTFKQSPEDLDKDFLLFSKLVFKNGTFKARRIYKKNFPENYNKVWKLWLENTERVDLAKKWKKFFSKFCQGVENVERIEKPKRKFNRVRNKDGSFTFVEAF